MTKSSTFVSRPDHYEKNYKMGEKIRVSPADLQHSDGSTPGIAIFLDRSYPFVVLTAEHAWHLANSLADALDSLQEGPSA